MPEQDKKTQKRYAFIMGANGPFNQRLKYAEKDVERLAKALTGNLCAFTSVVSEIAIEAQETLLRLQKLCRICEPSDLLVVHFSGNARVDQNLYLICNNTDHDSLIGSSIDIRQIKDILRTCRAQKKLLILDCSHAGAAHAGGGLNDSPKIENALRETLQGGASAILSASSRHQNSRELDTLDGGGGFLSWALATACSTSFQEVSPDGLSLSLTDIWRWLPQILKTVNNELPDHSRLPPPLLLNERVAVDDNEIWFTSIPSNISRDPSLERLISESRTNNSERGQHSSIEIEQLSSRYTIAGFQSDEPKGEDLLGITKEVNALCSIIAANDVQPPLSIGLFGDWGSGKSFFMRRMHARIEKIKTVAQNARGQSAYCEHIVQMEFNAWHFVDTNLWASLTAEIFEKLDEALAIGQKSDKEQERQRLLADTTKSRYVLAEELRRKEEAEAELEQSEQHLKQLQNEVSLVANLSVMDILRGTYQWMIQKPEIQAMIEDAARKLNLDKAIVVTQQTKEQLLQLHGLTGKIVALWLSVKNPPRRIIWLVPVLALVIVPFLISELLQFALANHIDKVTSYIVGLMLGILTSLGPFILPAKRAIEAIENARKQSQANYNKEHHQRLASLEQKCQQIQNEIDAAQKKVKDASENVKRLEWQLDGLRADRQMSNFIKQRHLSSDYSAHFGTIARAREDFEQLCILLEQVREQHSEELKREQKQTQEQEKMSKKNDLANTRPDLPRIDRIVLYIDDLDRCPEATVAEVLQAIHLLLAFPLFVVVVGVDSRWLVHSLRQHIKAFQTPLNNNSIERGNEHIHWESTPLNYLEKIFQIPYALRPMAQSGFNELIYSLTEQQRISSSLLTPYSMLSAAASNSKSDGSTSHITEPDSAEAQKQETKVNTSANVLIESLEPLAHFDTDAIDPNPGYLLLTDWERNYMTKLYSLIPSPRATKRFVNLYRLIRASIDDDKQSAFVGNAQRGQYQAVLLLLAMLSGYPVEATRILSDLLEQKNDEIWWSFIEHYHNRTVSSVSSNGASIVDPAPIMQTNRWGDLMGKLGALRLLISEEQDCQDFAAWAVEIARYSFQSGRVVFLQPELRTQ